ncbi:MAG TPA: NADH-quinone oxidoreductase subunit C, partial [Gaiellaceae bacterium]|nr:NADH-quinone oxidoreductase subunit C [Gaiellaceae bacterium]
RRFVLPPQAFDRATALLLEQGARFVTVHAIGDDPISAVAVLALRGELIVLRAPLRVENPTYPSLSLVTEAAILPERELHDVHGVLPLGHPDLEPLVRPDPDRLRRRVSGDEVFTIPYGPIRSGVFESIQYVIETAGEDVLALETRPLFKRRGLERRFEGLSPEQGVRLAERVAGIAGVAHAIAFAEAVERALGVEPPAAAHLWRVVHAELERIANHFDVAAKLAEDAALAVGAARFAILKEDVMRLRAALCGSRFGRGVVVPGGVTAPTAIGTGGPRRALDTLERDVRRDRRLLLRTTSFTDRLIGSGTLDRATTDALGAVGPVARAAGSATDARFERPYGGYRRLGFEVATALDGDAMARLQVRFAEITQSLHLIRQALDGIGRVDGALTAASPPRRERPAQAPEDGVTGAYGWVEAPQGELVYDVRLRASQVSAVRIASPSLRNWPLFTAAFRGDVLTDFSFIEHSFGLTPAGADR